MKAPCFELKEIRSGDPVRLSDYTGKPVMLTFWTSWCPDCMQDLPMKEQFYQHADPDTIGFLTINVTGRERSSDAGQDFASKNSLPFPVLADNGRETYEAYGCAGVPTTVLIDKNHNITHVFNDQSSFMDIVKALPAIME
ncbi:TlpA disulfide reductase family protein [Pseudalkalibacillus hwajinpoensis]|uniref:TlpA disulfide reductase family protein n=1 Tax=Guptibacillus hwajinpoensis TaxID=208199 RepID=UPI00325BCC3B